MGKWTIRALDEAEFLGTPNTSEVFRIEQGRRVVLVRVKYDEQANPIKEAGEGNEQAVMWALDGWHGYWKDGRLGQVWDDVKRTWHLNVPDDFRVLAGDMMQDVSIMATSGALAVMRKHAERIARRH